jgi:hypothetical protein
VFPALMRWRRRFVLEVLEGLAAAPKVTENGETPQFLDALSAELHNGLILEHVRVRFRLSLTQQVEWNLATSWETLCKTGWVVLSTQPASDPGPIYTVTFNQPSFARSLTRARQLVQDLPPGLLQGQDPTPALATDGRRRRSA